MRASLMAPPLRSLELGLQEKRSMYTDERNGDVSMCDVGTQGYGSGLGGPYANPGGQWRTARQKGNGWGLGESRRSLLCSIH